MGFVICLATDLLGRKVNFEVTLPQLQPTLRDVEHEADVVFNAEYARLGVAQRFAAQRWQVYDETRQKWTSLRTSNQSTLLRPACQVYALQRGWEHEMQAPIPNPTALPHFTAPLSPQYISESPQRDYSVPRNEVELQPPQEGTEGDLEEAYEQPMSDEGKVAALFHELNVRGNGALEMEEFRRGLTQLDMPFTAEQLREVFVKADENADGRLSFDEWRRMLANHPNLRDSLYFRSREFWEDAKLRQDMKSSTDQLEALQHREQLTRNVWQSVQDDLRALTERVETRRQNTERLAELVAQRERASEAALSDVAHSQRHLQEIETEAAKGREACEQRHGVYTTLATDVKALEERLVHAQTSAAEVLREEDIAAAQNAETKHQADAFRNKTIEKAGIFRQAHEREREAKELITAAQDETSRLEHSISVCDGNIENVTQAAFVAEGELARVASEVAVATETCQGVLQVVAAARLEEEASMRTALEAQRKVDAAEEAIRTQADALTHLAEQRELAAKNEQRIIDQEIRLRMQRQSLEQNEARLRAEHRAVMDVTLGSKYAR